MYLNYLEDVIAYYRTGEKNANLPQRLMRPTPGSIRDECLSVCKTRFHKKDLKTLTAFFAVETDRDMLLRIIGRCERDRFKPLVNFLKGNTSTTDDLNIELLAWLIDFPERPFKGGEYRKISLETSNEIQNSVSEKMEPEGKMEGIITIDHKEPGTDETVGIDLSRIKKAGRKIADAASVLFLNKRHALFAVIGALLLALSGIYLVANRTTLFARENKVLPKGIMAADNSYTPPGAAFAVNKITAPPYSHCKGNSPCTACSNCLYCNWCNSGGSCGKCASATKKKATQKRALQCQATTKKGKQCSRAAKSGGKYCWQHG